MSKRSLIGVLVGGVTNIVAANALNIPIAVYVMTTTGVLALPSAARKAVYLAELHANPPAFALSLATWAFCSILGGYVAARIARENEIVVGALSSWTCIALAVNALVHGISGQSVWQFLVWLPGSPLLSVLGAYVMQASFPRHGGVTPR